MVSSSFIVFDLNYKESMLFNLESFRFKILREIYKGWLKRRDIYFLQLLDKESRLHIPYMIIKLKDLHESNKALVSLYKNIYNYIYILKMEVLKIVSEVIE